MAYRRIILRRDVANNWQTNNPALRQGEVGIEIDQSGSGYNRMKVGDGFLSWNDLPYIDDAGLDILRTEYGDEVTFELGLNTTLN
jgi:hypothetical protein